MSEFNPYAILGVSLDAATDEILSAFRDKVRQLGATTSVTDPAYGQQLSVLRRAVHTLTDPERRKQYDASVQAAAPAPPAGSNGAVLADLEGIWRKVGTLFYERTPRFTPAFDAMEATVPLTVEGDDLIIIGIDPAQSSLLAHINATDTHNILKRILSEVCGRPMDFRTISSLKVRDWVILRDAEKRTSLRTAAALQKPAAPAPAVPVPAPAPEARAGDEWESLMETLMREWANRENRNYPQVRARLVLDLLALIARAEVNLRRSSMPEDLQERALARALDRVGSLTGIDAAITGIEYLRIRERTTPGGTS